MFTVSQGHLHGKTGQFTVWANGKQNSRPVNFIPGSRLPCAQTSSVRPRRPETGIKDRLTIIEHEFAFETYRPGTRPERLPFVRKFR